MNTMLTAICCTASVALLVLPMPADADPWDGVGGREVLMFQPGQSAWQWLVVPSRHEGARRLREGRTCLYCHEGEERLIGGAIGRGERLEPDPMPGMPQIIEVDVRMYNDADTLHMRLSWPATTAENRAGAAAVPTRLSVMFGSESIPATAVAGCWIACHTDLPAMPDAKSDPVLTKYIPNSRTRMTATGGEAVRSAADLAEDLAQGRILDYLQVALAEGKVARVSDGYILDARHEYDDTEVEAEASLADGRWTVMVRRPLAPSGSRLALQAGKIYSLNIALHDNYADGRRHYVAYPLSMALGSVDADIIVNTR